LQITKSEKRKKFGGKDNVRIISCRIYALWYHGYMPNEPQKDQTIATPPVPSVISKGERVLGSVPEIAPPPVEPSVAVPPERLGTPPVLVAAPDTFVKDKVPPPRQQQTSTIGDFSHLPPESRLFGVAQMASNWIRRILGREGEKGKERLKAKTV